MSTSIALSKCSSGWKLWQFQSENLKSVITRRQWKCICAITLQQWTEKILRRLNELVEHVASNPHPMSKNPAKKHRNFQSWSSIYTFSKLETRGYVPRLQTIYTSQQLPLDISLQCSSWTYAWAAAFQVRSASSCSVHSVFILPATFTESLLFPLPLQVHESHDIDAQTLFSMRKGENDEDKTGLNVYRGQEGNKTARIEFKPWRLYMGSSTLHGLESATKLWWSVSFYENFGMNKVIKLHVHVFWAQKTCVSSGTPVRKFLQQQSACPKMVSRIF